MVFPQESYELIYIHHAKSQITCILYYSTGILYFSFQLLLLFLCRIIAKQKENKMDLNNVAMIMAPNLFLNTGNKSGVTLREAEMAKGTINIVRMLIKYHAILWTVSVLICSVLDLKQIVDSEEICTPKSKEAN